MNVAIILAAGRGERMENFSSIPKQLLEVKGKPILAYSLEAFSSHPLVEQIIIVTKNEYLDAVNQIITGVKLDKPYQVVIGGNTRQQSVYNALLVLQATRKPNDLILIHDAARPLVSEKIITENIEQAHIHGAVCTAVRINDTAIYSDETEMIENYLVRERVFLAQTPQTFAFKIILAAHKKAHREHFILASDDSQLVRLLDKPIKLVHGSPRNFKVTTKEDISLLNEFLRCGDK